MIKRTSVRVDLLRSHTNKNKKATNSSIIDEFVAFEFLESLKLFYFNVSEE
jgi:hypothetical protein